MRMGEYFQNKPDFSKNVPKPLVEIGGRPILWHIMKTYSHYGYNDFIIALGVKGHVIKEYFYNFDSLNNDFTIDKYPWFFLFIGM